MSGFPRFHDSPGGLMGPSIDSHTLMAMTYYSQKTQEESNQQRVKEHGQSPEETRHKLEGPLPTESLRTHLIHLATSFSNTGEAPWRLSAQHFHWGLVRWASFASHVPKAWTPRKSLSVQQNCIVFTNGLSTGSDSSQFWERWAPS